MWRRLVLRDFQAHVRLTVEFGPGVTTIIGRSDAGKSAVVRALRWVCFNRPKGNAVVRHGAGPAMVSLVTAAHKVVRKKGAGVNLYALDGRKLVAFGADVPDLVRAALNVSPVNFARQFDPPFWLTLPPVELGKRLNEITGLDVAETVKTKLAAKVRHVGADVRVLAEQLEAAKRRLSQAKAFAGVIAAKKAADATGDEHAKIALSLTRLAKLAETLSAARTAKDGAEALVGGLARRIDTLTAARTARARRQHLHRLLAAAPAVPEAAPALAGAFREWDAARQVSTHAYARRGLLETLLDDYHKENKLWRRLNRRRLELEAAGVCPTCGRAGTG